MNRANRNRRPDPSLEATRGVASSLAARPFFIFYLCLSVVLAACAAFDVVRSDTSPVASRTGTSPTVCPVTAPEWVKPPDDPAVDGSPEAGYYYVNQDRTIWASAWWEEAEDYPLRAGEAGIKVGWFRPAGAPLEITGQRLDGEAPPLEAHVPCCYPTRFQATGLMFPTEGCWEVTARAADRELPFVVRVVP